MRFSTRSEYGLRALATLAQSYDQGYLSLAKVAKKNHLSLSYLERLFAKLKKAGIVNSAKGKAGGYRLAKKPKDVSLDKVVAILEGSTATYRCLEPEIQCHNQRCKLRQVWLQVQKQVNQTLAKVTIKDLI